MRTKAGRWPYKTANTFGTATCVVVALFMVLHSLKPAQGAESTCDPPVQNKQGRTFFVDPVRGAMTNDGSAERPWRTLAEVFDPKRKLISTHIVTRSRDGSLSRQTVNPDGPVKPGDTILLMSGDHGDLLISGLRNERVINIAAAPGQTPVIRQMTLNSSSRWSFANIKFQGARRADDRARAIVHLGASNWLGDAENITFKEGSFSTTDDVSEWSKEDWINRPFETGLWINGKCVTVTGSRFFHVRNALTITGEGSNITENNFDNFGNDAIQLAAGTATIVRNRIQNGRSSPAEPQHADAIQGWTMPGRVNRNVLIANNWIANLRPPDDNYLQGISIFDGEWDGVRIENNVVLTNAWHGITLFGVKNAAIVNNTVISTRPDRFTAWIQVREGKAKQPSTNAIVRNNIAAAIIVPEQTAQVDHNAASERIESLANGRMFKLTMGTDSRKNVVHPRLLTYFADLSLSAGKTDLRPRPPSAAIGAGTSEGAPSEDYFGRRREAPFDAGAVAR